MLSRFFGGRDMEGIWKGWCVSLFMFLWIFWRWRTYVNLEEMIFGCSEDAIVLCLLFQYRNSRICPWLSNRLVKKVEKTTNICTVCSPMLTCQIRTRSGHLVALQSLPSLWMPQDSWANKSWVNLPRLGTQRSKGRWLSKHSQTSKWQPKKKDLVLKHLGSKNWKTCQIRQVPEPLETIGEREDIFDGAFLVPSNKNSECNAF